MESDFTKKGEIVQLINAKIKNNRNETNLRRMLIFCICIICRQCVVDDAMRTVSQQFACCLLLLLFLLVSSTRFQIEINTTNYCAVALAHRSACVCNEMHTSTTHSTWTWTFRWTYVRPNACTLQKSTPNGKAKRYIRTFNRFACATLTQRVDISCSNSILSHP